MKRFFSNVIVMGVSALAASSVVADDVDVYLVLGQSNAGNFAETASTGSTDVGFNLDFARVQDRPDFLVGPGETSGAFSTRLLEPTNAVSVLAQGLHNGKDVAVLSYIRNGASITPGINFYSNGTPYYWGSDPSVSPQPDNTSLYGAHLAWVGARLTEISSRGDTPVVKGVFWYQGEGDAGANVSSAVYQAGLEGLLDRLRSDYGADLPVIATEIRNGNVASGYNLNQSNAINDAAKAVAASDDFFDIVDPNDLSYRSANDVHLNNSGLADLAPIWTDAYLQIVPEPSSLVLLGLSGLVLIRRRR
ncbi:MAG: sialate O-acetylesterase [Phycisphaeraceae bacterium]